jgi:hypothetical protein
VVAVAVEEEVEEAVAVAGSHWFLVSRRLALPPRRPIKLQQSIQTLVTIQRLFLSKLTMLMPSKITRTPVLVVTLKMKYHSERP